MGNLFGKVRNPQTERERDRERLLHDRRISEEERHSNGHNRPRLPGNKAIALARQHLQDLTGHIPESVSSLHSQDGRWKVTLDVVELERIPRTTDVMASYEIELDERGELLGYRRVGRYYRSQVDQG